MFKVKFKNNLANFLIAAMLAVFVAGQFLSLAHSLSHHENNVAVTKDIPAPKHDVKDCALCSFNNSANQIIAVTTFIFAAIYFALAFFSRKFDRVKFSYLLSSNLSRAPPALS